MKLRNYLLSDQNIYLAIYAVRSYVFNPQLLCSEDQILLNELLDPYNEKICDVISDVKNIVTNILDDEDYLFKTQVYFKPKDYCEEGPIYRPIHTAELKQLIAMVAVLHPLIYELPAEDNNWKLNLSNYSRLIPKNFYGNRVSSCPEELFKKWNNQYKKYTQKANEYFKTFHETKEYKYELKLDLKNYFPSVNPLIVYGFIVENMPVTFNEIDDVHVFKTIVYKLLVCEVTNLNTNLAKRYYYGTDNIENIFTKGIAQGLPQSYFFGNICMIKVDEIFREAYGGKAVYYVDDSYIYTNQEIANQEEFSKQIENINSCINDVTEVYIKKSLDDNEMVNKEKFIDFLRVMDNVETFSFEIKVHTEGKSTYTNIKDSSDGEIYLRTLSREASQIGTDIFFTYSEEEDETILHRTEALLSSIEKELEDKREQKENKEYVDKLERYYKFFKYREIKLKLKTEKILLPELFDVLFGSKKPDITKDIYSLLREEDVEKAFFFHAYKHDIWQVGISLLISNTDTEHDSIKVYLKKIIDVAYSSDLLECAYLNRIYEDYLNNAEIILIPNCYKTLEKKTNQKLVRYSNLNSKILRNEFEGTKLLGLKDNILKSFGICSDDFVDACIIVTENSDRMQRMFLNAVYSKIFKVAISEEVVINSYDKKGITYGELRTLVYLRNNNCNVKKFLLLNMDIMKKDNLQNVDYTVFEVLSAFKKYVSSPDYIDNLIKVHKYTCDVWKNGAKHLYFYTLHNQEHAVDLIKNVIKIVKAISYFKISAYDYYILFISCYLHDISMVKIASKNDFLLDKQESEKIVTKIETKWNNYDNIKEFIVDIYKEVDQFFENKVRSKHAKESAREIRNRAELKFLDCSARENIAEIAESHMMDTSDIYYLKSDAKNKLISYKFDKIILRFADLLDMSEHRVSMPILNHNIDNMSVESAFHWVSHLLTEGYSLVSSYRLNSDLNEKSFLLPGRITEIVELSINVNLSQLSKMDSACCKYGKLIDDSLKNKGFSIELCSDGEECNSEKCNFLCRWFNQKNYYLIQEMQALEAYLNRIPVEERFYNTKIIIKVIIQNPTDLSDEKFEILSNKILNR